jgi:hypothetical protein
MPFGSIHVERGRMTPKTWKSCLGVLCLLAAGTANAAKISFSEKGFIDIGALIQAQYRIEQDAAASGKDPSNDFLFRRARLQMAGQYDEHISFFMDTDVSYGAIGGAGAGTGTGFGAGPNGSSTYVTDTGSGFNNNLYLLDAVATYKVNSSFMLDAGLMLLPYSHNSLTSGARYASVNLFPTYFNAGSNRGFRDVGVLIRGLLLDDRLYYRLGVFNGVQTATNTAVPPAASNGFNPGDAPELAGMLRFNIAGKEDGYAFCQVCFASSPIVSVGVSAIYQVNSFRGSAPQSPTAAAIPTGLRAYTVANADIFADIPFPGDLELSMEVLGTKVWAGNGVPQTGWGVFGLAAFRFGVFGLYGQVEYFNSDTNYVGTTIVGTTKTNFFAGDNKTYRGGVNWFIEKHTYKISAEIAFQDREQAGSTIPSGTTPATTGNKIADNHWVGTLQFQVAF